VTAELPVLYSFRRCPYAIRARITLAHSAVRCTLREVVLREKPDDLLSLSPKGTVPVLLLRDGRIIEESLDIMLWALSQFDPDGWLEGEATMTHALIEENDTSFKQALDRYKYHVRYPENVPSVYRDQAASFIARLESLLSGNRGQGLMASRVTLADIEIFPFVRQFAGVDRVWFDAAPYPLLQQWLRRFESWSGFTRVMTKYTPWLSDEGPGVPFP